MLSEFKVVGSSLNFKLMSHEVENTETGIKYHIYNSDGKSILLKVGKPVDHEVLMSTSLTEPSIDGLRPILMNERYSLWKDGREYYTHSLAIDTKSNVYVVYQALYGDKTYYARPYELFASKVDEDRMSDNNTGQAYRFELIKDSK